MLAGVATALRIVAMAGQGVSLRPAAPDGRVRDSVVTMRPDHETARPQLRASQPSAEITASVLVTTETFCIAALGRGQTVPARHRLAREPGSAVADLVRLLLLAEPVPAARAGAALPLAEAVALGLIRREPGTGGLVRALTQLQPYPVPSGTVYSPPTSRPMWLPGRRRWRPIT